MHCLKIKNGLVTLADPTDRLELLPIDYLLSQIESAKSSNMISCTVANDPLTYIKCHIKLPLENKDMFLVKEIAEYSTTKNIIISDIKSNTALINENKLKGLTIDELNEIAEFAEDGEPYPEEN